MADVGIPADVTRAGTATASVTARARTWLPSPSACIAAVIAVLAVTVSFPPAQHPQQPVKLFPDSATYLAWTIGRPPFPWLFYTLVGVGPATCVVQTMLSVTCWTAFGWSVLGVGGALAAAVLAVAAPIGLWNFTVLSEPLTLSIAGALLALTVALGRGWTLARALAWSATALAFTAVRVENFVVVPILAAALWTAHPARWRALVGVTVGAAALFVAFGFVLDTESKNWQIRMTNVVLTRILPDQDLGHEFERRGLPIDATLLRYRGEMLKYYDPAFRAATPVFQQWLDSESRATYLRWLATAAPHRLLVRSMNHVMNWPEDRYYTTGVQLPAIGIALAPVYGAAALPFRLWIGLATVPIACALLSRRRRFIDVFALAFLVLVYVLAFVEFHGDTGELPRHMVLAATLYRLAPIVVLGSVWDRLGPAPAAR